MTRARARVPSSTTAARKFCSQTKEHESGKKSTQAFECVLDTKMKEISEKKDSCEGNRKQKCMEVNGDNSFYAFQNVNDRWAFICKHRVSDDAMVG